MNELLSYTAGTYASTYVSNICKYYAILYKVIEHPCILVNLG